MGMNERMGQDERAKVRPFIKALNPNHRPKVNGPRTVKEGRIVNKGIADYDYALRLKKALELDFPNFTYVVSGIRGDYRIIEYDKEPTHSFYVH